MTVREGNRRQVKLDSELCTRLYDWDRRHIIHPATNWAEQREAEARVVVDAEGSKLWDAEGNEYIDGIAGLWLANAGYGREELAQAASEQLKKLAYYPLFFGWSHEPAINLAHRLSELAPGELNHVLFTSGGSEANESSIKYARMYHALQGKPDKYKIIARSRAYHGVSYGAVSATGLKSLHANIGPLNPGFVHVDPPYCYYCPWGKEYPGCGLECVAAVERCIQREGPDTVAAFIAEPVIGVGGAIVPPREYFPRVRKLCDEYDVVLIADEVITGFGRLGYWFGTEHWDVAPDIISTAKGITSGYLPLGASIISDAIFDVIADSGVTMSHGYTYSGHPAAAAVALANIDILEREDLFSRSREMGTFLLQLLQDLDNPHIGAVRGLGLMIGIELVSDRDEGMPFPDELEVNFRVEAATFARKVIVRALGTTVIGLSPPLVITREECRVIVEALDEAISEVCSQVQ